MQAETARIEAEREAQTSSRVKEFLVGLFEAADPWQSRGKQVTAQEMLDNGAKDLEKVLQNEPR